MLQFRTGAVALFLTLSIAPAVRAQADSLVTRLTMQEALDRALRNSPEIVRATGSLTTAEWGERTAWGAYLPSLSLSSGSGRSSSSRFDERTQTSVTGSSESYSAGASASYDLFTGGRRGAERDRARANSRSAEAELVESRFAVILQTKTAFFNVQRQVDLERVAQGDIRRSEEALTAAQRRLQVGSATRSDVLRAQLDLNNAKQSLLNIQTQQRAAGYALGVLVGISAPVGVRVDSLVAPRPLPLAEAEIVRLAVQQAPAINTATAAVNSADASTSVARASYLPTLRFSSGYDWSNNQATFQNGNTGWNLRLSASYPLFNQFSREASVANANVNLRNAQAALETARRQVRADVERALGDLKLADQRIDLANEALAVAQEDLRVNQERYRVGMSTILDLLLSQNAMRTAENNLVSARYDYEIARAQLEALIGRPL
jgi:TolC family type I secretion outer membrane protein